jgi:hypothetical protein
LEGEHIGKCGHRETPGFRKRSFRGMMGEAILQRMRKGRTGGEEVNSIEHY